MPKRLPDPNFGILVRQPYLAISAELQRRLATAGFGDLRPAHLVIFQHVAPEGTRITTLADRAQLTKPSITYLVNSLEQLGYVERVPDPSDKRASIVRFTERGWRQVRTALKILGDIEDEWARHLGRRKFAALRRGLLDLNEVVLHQRS